MNLKTSPTPYIPECFDGATAQNKLLYLALKTGALLFFKNFFCRSFSLTRMYQASSDLEQRWMGGLADCFLNLYGA